MADNEHLRRIRDGADAWNAWGTEQPDKSESRTRQLLDVPEVTFVENLDRNSADDNDRLSIVVGTMETLAELLRDLADLPTLDPNEIANIERRRDTLLSVRAMDPPPPGLANAAMHEAWKYLDRYQPPTDGLRDELAAAGLTDVEAEQQTALVEALSNDIAGNEGTPDGGEWQRTLAIAADLGAGAEQASDSFWKEARTRARRGALDGIESLAKRTFEHPVKAVVRVTTAITAAVYMLTAFRPALAAMVRFALAVLTRKAP